jgi:hypothetical protein
MTLDVSDILTDPDVGVPVTITRTAAPTITNGRPSAAGAATTVITTASVQPLPTKELQLLPEGMRAQGVVAVFSGVELLVLPQPDTFVYKGATWQLSESADWSDAAGYYRYLAVRVTET